MDLIELFDSLELPIKGEGKIFTAALIEGLPNSRMAVDSEGNPVLLLSVSNPVKDLSIKNIKLKYLQLSHNVECSITEYGESHKEIFTIIAFTNQSRHLQEYFLRVAEVLIDSFGGKPTQVQVVDSLKQFIEVFRTLNKPPTNTVQGLWAELLLIDLAQDPSTLVRYWHNDPMDRFDFNSGEEKIEVKSNGNFERIHVFSSHQLNPPMGTKALIGSIFIKPFSSGYNIQDLFESISNKIRQNSELCLKLNKLIIMTLGSSLEQAIQLRFDHQTAKDSLRFYKTEDIMKIEEISIPDEVSEVRYKSDLSNIQSMNLSNLRNKGELFNAASLMFANIMKS